MLSQLCAERRFRLILNVVDHLPSTSHYRQAIAMDEELAEVFEQLDTGEKTRRKLQVSEASTEVLQLLEVTALLRQLVQMQASKKIPFQPLPQVETAASRLREIKRKQHRGRLLELVDEAHRRWRADHPDDEPG